MATKIIRAGKTLGTTAATSQKGVERAIVRAVLSAGFRAHGPMDRALSTRDEYAVQMARVGKSALRLPRHSWRGKG